MKRPQLIVFVSAVLLFVMGVMVGLLAHRLYDANAVSASEDWRIRYVNEMHSRLKLDTQQIDKLNDILDDTRQKVHAVKDSYRPAMISIKQEQIAQVKSILKPEQVEEYNKIVAEREQRAKTQDGRDRENEQQRAEERHRREQLSNGAGTK